MSADEPDSDESTVRATFGGPVVAILITFGTIGAVLAVVSAEGRSGPNVSLLWGSLRVGFAIAVLYLLTKIANGNHEER